MADANANASANSSSGSTPSARDSSPSRRNWNGPPGDRYVHESAWVVGGPKGPATTAPWKLDAPVEGAEQRRGSNASISSTSSNSGRRKSSTPGLFANLEAQKRTSPESDPGFAARRESWSEQRPKGGPFARWWDGYTRGP